MPSNGDRYSVIAQIYIEKEVAMAKPEQKIEALKQVLEEGKLDESDRATILKTFAA
jgi:hypothetical protein